MISRAARFGVAAAVAIVDRASKHWIETRMGAWDTHTVIPGVFNIVHTQNRGAAFGVLADAGDQWRQFALVGVATAVMLLVAFQLWRMPKGSWPASNRVAIPLSAMLGGAIGNLYDRIVRGSVTDFLQVFIGPYEWPSFNVADSAISVGAAFLLLSFWLPGRRAE